MDEKIEQILQESTYKFTPEQYNAALKDAKSMDTRSWIEKYQPEFEKDKQLAVAWKAAGLDKYSKDKWERYREAFGSSDTKNPFNRSDNWLKATWQNDFSDIPYEQYRKDIESNKQFWEDERRARDYEAGKKLREREVKNWPLWKNIVASDYAKQRYINEPEKSLFNGDNTLRLGMTKWGETPKLGDVLEGSLLNKGEDISDLAYGAAGAAGDALPGYGTFAGPAVRAMRDVQHKVTDSPYQKEWSDIGQDVLSDAAINFGVEYMPTAILNRGRRAGKNIGKSDEVLSDYAAEMNFAQRQQANDAAFEYLRKNEGMFDDARVAQIRVNSMPESDIKNDIVKLVNSDDYSKRQLLKYMDAYEKANKEGINAYRYVTANSTTRPNKRMKTADLGDNTIDFFKSKERLMGLPESKLRTSVAKLSTKYAPAGQTVVKEIDTAKGRGSQPEVDTQLVKEWYKQNYARDWSLDKPFKPNKKEDDPLWEAYVEFRKEHGLEI